MEIYWNVTVLPIHRCLKTKCSTLCFKADVESGDPELPVYVRKFINVGNSQNIFVLDVKFLDFFNYN